ncbi:MAG: hypothetical protein PHE49_07240 [bacterium]|nr:hypothetical protein [bacterium]
MSKKNVDTISNGALQYVSSCRHNLPDGSQDFKWNIPLCRRYAVMLFGMLVV